MGGVVRLAEEVRHRLAEALLGMKTTPRARFPSQCQQC